MACNRPYLLKTKSGEYLVPCGICRQCRIDYREEWTMRLMMETQKHNGAYITLTYNDENCPQNVEKGDIQRFFKRLRKNIDWKGKYYVVSEYGEEGDRPHYHGILSGISPLRNDIIQATWGLGFTKTGAVNPTTIRYVLKYMEKAWIERKAEKTATGKEPNFKLISKGIGREWLENNIENIEKNGLWYKGRKVPLPRYYKKISGLKETGQNEEKRKKIIETVEKMNVTAEKAVNMLGEINEEELRVKENLFGK